MGGRDVRSIVAAWLEPPRGEEEVRRQLVTHGRARGRARVELVLGTGSWTKVSTDQGIHDLDRCTMEIAAEEYLVENK